jgi:hypothetical protein
MKETWIYFIQPPFAPPPHNPECRLGFKSWLAGGKVFHSNDLFFSRWLSFKPVDFCLFISGP